MGQRPRSGDIPWLPAHSILNWIGGDTSMLDLSLAKSRLDAELLRFCSRSGKYYPIEIGLRPRVLLGQIWWNTRYRSNTQLTLSLFPATFYNFFPSYGLRWMYG